MALTRRNPGLSLVAKAIAILRKYGTDAHIYLPGIGTVSGLTAGNYLDSAGTTAATVDNPVGLSLDALQGMTLGSELVVGASNAGNNGWTPIGSGGVKVAGGATGSLYGPYGAFGTTYLMVVVVSALSGTITPQLGTSQQTTITAPGTYSYVITPTAGGGYFYLDAPAATTATVTSVSIKQVPGIHASQATTANKPILRQSAGKYSWQFDGVNDSLSLSAPLFQMSDDHAVIAGINGTSANKYIFTHSNTGTATQVCSIRVDASGFPGAVWIDDATENALPTGSVSCVGVTTVIAAVKNGNAKKLFVNGVQSGTTDNTVLGAGTTNNYSIGSLNNTSGNFQGSIYPVIAIKGTVTDADLLTLERFVGQLSGVSI